jgi:hypothetical protein
MSALPARKIVMRVCAVSGHGRIESGASSRNVTPVI